MFWVLITAASDAQSDEIRPGERKDDSGKIRAALSP
jgi:hypothetical protein